MLLTTLFITTILILPIRGWTLTQTGLSSLRSLRLSRHHDTQNSCTSASTRHTTALCLSDDDLEQISKLLDKFAEKYKLKTMATQISNLEVMFSASVQANAEVAAERMFGLSFARSLSVDSMIDACDFVIRDNKNNLISREDQNRLTSEGRSQISSDLARQAGSALSSLINWIIIMEEEPSASLDDALQKAEQADYQAAIEDIKVVCSNDNFRSKILRFEKGLDTEGKFHPDFMLTADGPGVMVACFAGTPPLPPIGEQPLSGYWGEGGVVFETVQMNIRGIIRFGADHQVHIETAEVKSSSVTDVQKTVDQLEARASFLQYVTQAVYANPSLKFQHSLHLFVPRSVKAHVIEKKKRAGFPANLYVHTVKV